MPEHTVVTPDPSHPRCWQSQDGHTCLLPRDHEGEHEYDEVTVEYPVQAAG